MSKPTGFSTIAILAAALAMAATPLAATPPAKPLAVEAPDASARLRVDPFAHTNHSFRRPIAPLPVASVDHEIKTDCG